MGFSQRREILIFSCLLFLIICFRAVSTSVSFKEKDSSITLFKDDLRMNFSISESMYQRGDNSSVYLFFSTEKDFLDFQYSPGEIVAEYDFLQIDNIEGAQIDGDTFYFRSRSPEQIWVFDISNILSPVHKGTIYFTSGIKIYDFYVSNDVLFVGSSEGLHFIDIQDPKRPKIIDSMRREGEKGSEKVVRSVRVKNDVVFIGIQGGDVENWPRIEIWNITSITQRTRLWTSNNCSFSPGEDAPTRLKLSQDFPIRHPSIHGNLLFAHSGPPQSFENGYTRIYDISNLASPILKSKVNVSGCYDFAVLGEELFLPSTSDEKGYFFNISDLPESPILVRNDSYSYYDVPTSVRNDSYNSTPTSVVVDNRGVVYVAGSGFLWTVDGGGAEAPLEEKKLFKEGIGEPALILPIRDDPLLIVKSEPRPNNISEIRKMSYIPGFTIFDTTDKNQLSPISYIRGQNIRTSYPQNRTGDMGDPSTEPSRGIGIITDGFGEGGLKLFGDYLFVGGHLRIHVFDISTNERPIWINEIVEEFYNPNGATNVMANTACEIMDILVDVESEVLFVATVRERDFAGFPDCGLFIFNISNVRNITKIRFLTSHSYTGVKKFLGLTESEYFGSKMLFCSLSVYGSGIGDLYIKGFEVTDASNPYELLPFGDWRSNEEVLGFCISTAIFIVRRDRDDNEYTIRLYSDPLIYSSSFVSIDCKTINGSEILFVLRRGFGLEIFDVSMDMIEQERLGYHLVESVLEEEEAVVVDGKFAYVIQGKTTSEVLEGETSDLLERAILIFDISDLKNPVLLSNTGSSMSPVPVRYGTDRLAIKNNYIYALSYDRGIQVIKNDLQVVGKNLDLLCGTTKGTVTALESSTGETSDLQIVLTKATYCHNNGLCYVTPEGSKTCICADGYSGDLCDEYKCFGVYSTFQGEVCDGSGRCIGPDECKCDDGFGGENCDTNEALIEVVVPLGSTFFVIAVVVIVAMILMCFFSICAFCCVILCAAFFVFVFVLGFVCSCGLFAFSCFSLFGLRMFKAIWKYRKLKNFDLYLKEQELEEDPTRASLKFNKKLFEIDYKDIHTVDILGEGGSNSIVFRAMWAGKVCAYKCFKTRQLMSSGDKFDEFEREVELLSSLSHPNIIQFYGASLHPPRVGIVMEFCENGELLEFVIKFRAKNLGAAYPIFQKLRLLMEVASAFEFLHSKNILHRDLKPENVLINGFEIAKVMDFGLSRLVDSMSQKKTQRIGTSAYIAPEVMLVGEYTEKVDVFSYAILIFVLMTEDAEPYDDMNKVELRVMNDGDYRPDRSKLLDSLPNEFDWLVELVEKCWNHEPKVRLSFTEIREVLENNGKIEDTLKKGKDVQPQQILVDMESEEVKEGEGGGMYENTRLKRIVEERDREIEKLRSELKKFRDKFEKKEDQEDEEEEVGAHQEEEEESSGSGSDDESSSSQDVEEENDDFESF